FWSESSTPFAAFDLHKKEVEAVILSGLGEVTHRERFPTTRDALLDFAKRQLTPTTHLALEATTNTWPVVELLRPYVLSITVSNPMKTRAIAEAKIKTDKVDALILANLLRLNYLPAVWCPDAQTQALRRLATERTMLVNDRTRIKNRIHSILHQRLIHAPDANSTPESAPRLLLLDISQLQQTRQGHLKRGLLLRFPFEMKTAMARRF
ncbi:MAG: transposase, partial [Acidobacteriota bacterium]